MLLSFLPVFKGKQFCDFLFAFLNEKHFQTGVYSERKEFARRGANTYLLDLTPIERGGKIKMAELLPLKVYQLILKHRVAILIVP